mmetsp:Transcript_29896/g.45304  ORF Transcript_29896/g.45304 Transcript_29896/m.45304 type:complete len:793 (+) Transcript_29896:257-2635(+)|eukprot:CAMPEP_0178901174 /NCGR_PEP_ID=MMETSP0786-20121207/3872_1 /TAXON_ID=186022 /ORGANISM="Thalassionema frauenfeldii, Strain CCMP 1798" /LENGTH=792 /DNA_ID=CAMNT_0020572239 /DNA_START=233 /DNA_END=2611 /DNA_ORIENTATION=+
MDHQIGIDFSSSGSVMNKRQLEEQRRKRGECLTCGEKCFQKKLFKLIPLTVDGVVLDGRCLKCKPLDATNASENLVLPAASRPATREDLQRFKSMQLSMRDVGRDRSQRTHHPKPRNHANTISRPPSLPEDRSEDCAPMPAAPKRATSMAIPKQTPMPQRSASVTVARAASLAPNAHNIHDVYRQSHSLPESSTSNSQEMILPPIEYDQTLSLESSGHERQGYESAGNSSRSFKSEDEESNDNVPLHGILNRGGEFKYEDKVVPLEDGEKKSDPHRAMAGSSRTIGSMSSIEEDIDHEYGARQISWTPKDEKLSEKVTEESNDDLSIDSETGSCRSKENGSTYSSISGRRSSTQDNRQLESLAIERLSTANDDYCTVISIMRELPISAIVQQESLKHISEMRLSDDEYSEIMDIGVLEDIKSAMVTHLNNNQLQCFGCRAIWNLSATTPNQIRLIEEGALDCILGAMKTFPAESDVQEKALSALSNLGAAAENQEKILNSDTLEQIVAAMNKHAENSVVQSKACSALTNLASYDSTLKREIMNKNGGGAVVISMIMHPEDIELQEKALRALRNICANNDENKVEVANVGGIDAVISAMQVHRDEAGVQEAGAWTLSNLAVNPQNKAIIGDSGGIDVVVRAMWVHSDNDGVQEWCCRALWTLSVDAQNRLVMMEVGCISAIVNAMQAHTNVATVQEKGCGVLSNLAATDDEIRIKIVEEEGLDAIIMAMVIHAGNRAVQDRACSVLKRLAIGPNISAMQAVNVVGLVSAAAENFPEKCAEKAGAILSAMSNFG